MWRACHSHTWWPDPSVLERAHIVVTSYSVATSEFKNHPMGKDESGSKGKGKGKKKVQEEDSEDDSDSDDMPRRPAPKRGKTMDALFRVKWWRIVLGE